MDKKIKLSEHIKRGSTFYTPFTDPNGMGEKLTLSSWSRNNLPQFLWIGLIINNFERKKGLEIMYLIIQDLQKSNIAIPEMSQIFSLDEDKQKLFWTIIESYIEKDVLTPLTIVITPDINSVFYNEFFDLNIDIEDCVSEILNVMKICNNFHDELSTDICFIVDWFYVISEKLIIYENIKELPKALSEYYNHAHDDEIMRMYRPMIRSTFKVLSTLYRDDNFSEKFWQELAAISDCNPLILIWEENNSMDFYNMVSKVIEYFSVTNDDKKMEEKYVVIMGMTCYIYRLYKEIVEKNLMCNISGRILFRTMLETYINLKYLIKKEEEFPEIFENFKAYGYGKYKLVMAKLREGKYHISEEAQINDKYLEFIVNEDYNEAFVDLDFNYFDKVKIKEKFVFCEENDLYEIYYEYATNYTHGIWGAIRESCMLKCDNPAHLYHTVPDYFGEQELRSVLYDCEMVMRKTLKVISSYVDLPDFYSFNDN